MIIFRKKIKNFVWIPDWEDKNETKPVKVLTTYDDILYHLSDNLIIEDGVTFEEFFTPIIEKWKDFEVLFASQLGHFSLKQFYEEWNRPFRLKDDENIEDVILEVGWGPLELNVGDYAMTQPHYPIFHGIKKLTEDEKKEQHTKDDTMYVALEFTPINELKEYKFRVNDNVEIFQWNWKEEEKLKKLGNFQQGLSFYQAVGTILYEITFLGSIEDRDSTKEDLINSAKDIEEELKNGNFLKDSVEINFDEDGKMSINNISTNENESPSSLDELLKKCKIDRPKEDDNEKSE